MAIEDEAREEPEASEVAEAPAVVLAFLARLAKDREAGVVRSLRAYQEAFPGYPELIAREHARLSEPPESAARGGDPTAGGPGGDRLTPGEEDEEQIDGYRLVELLGRGGMGAVWLARQERPLERDVAIKVIHSLLDSHRIVARFELERQTLARMQHPGIARVYDAGVTRSGRPYFAMEYVPGVPITRHAAERELEIEERLRLFTKVCDALQHAHHKGVVHRDIKPSNVLVAREGEAWVVKLIDFGIAKSTSETLAEDPELTLEGQVVGTPAYMSPEQWELGGLACDVRSDVYSLGVLLYELLVGQSPYGVRASRGEGILEFARRLLEEEPTRPSTAVGGPAPLVPPPVPGADPHRWARRLRGDLDWIALRALEKEPARRYQSARELAEDIDRHLGHLPVRAGPPGLAYRARKLLRRRRAAVTFGALALLLVVIASLVAWRATLRERVEASRHHLGEATSHAAAFHAASQRAVESESVWRRASAEHEKWEPVWRRAEELAARSTLRELRAEASHGYHQAVISAQRALELALPGSREQVGARSILRDLLLPRLARLERGALERLEPEFLSAILEAAGLGDLDAPFARAHLRIETEPPGAELYCYRCEEIEGRRVPLPFDPRRGVEDPRGGLVGEPHLVVERIWRDRAPERVGGKPREGEPSDPSAREAKGEEEADAGRDPDPAALPFEVGDVLREAAGRELHTLSDLVAVVEAVRPGEEIGVVVRREGVDGGRGRALRLGWRPRPASSPAGEPLLVEADDVRRRLGFTLASQPLERLDACRIGRSAPGRPVEIELPRGSYLLVASSPGRAPARFPIVVPLLPGQEEGRIEVPLLESEEIPPGFVPIPAGPFAAGGDPEVDQSLPFSHPRLETFFIGRTEVTVGEYLAFLEAPENIDRIDAEGFAPPRVDWERTRLGGVPVRELLPPALRAKPRVRLIPRYSAGADRTPLMARDGSRFRLRRIRNLDWPLLGISPLAALEYAHWYDERHGEGRWRFRLPTDLEWEKAARGVDRRPWVWGDVLVASFCRSLAGVRGAGRPEVVGAAATDESIWGVRDLAGSVSEVVLGRTEGRFVSLRGGNWYEATDYFLRAANRNGILPESDAFTIGLRLAAEPLAPARDR